MENIEQLWLDSGGHSLYTKYVIQRRHAEGYAFYETQEFFDYCDQYAEFVKKNKRSIDYYIAVDAIFNPKLTWKNQKYLEREHGLKPIPVIHANTPIEWVKKYLDDGHDYLGIGGLGQEMTVSSYIPWADRLFSYLCPPPSRRPICRTHGFAMTSWMLLTRYPFASVDSASWVKSAAFGGVLIPRKHKGRYSFLVEPYNICVSGNSPSTKKRSHVFSISPEERRIVQEWLEIVDVPYGKSNKEGEVIEEGVINHYGPRVTANLRFYDAMTRALPEVPWAFKKTPRKQFFSSENNHAESNGTFDKQRLNLCYSGCISPISVQPESVLGDKQVSIMLTYHALQTQSGVDYKRFKRHRKRRRQEVKA